MNIYEKMYERKYLNRVIHTTLNPKNPGVVRLHLVPSKFSLFKARPSIVILNGKDIIPLNPSWSILLSIFIDEVNRYKGKEISEKELEDISKITIYRMKKIYHFVKKDVFKEDLINMINLFVAISNKEKVDIDLGQLSISDFAKFMRAPHRIDLMISSMKKNNHWNCNQQCMYCYAANQEYAETKELSTAEWKKVIDICKKNCIPQITFTGGEPTVREDLVELVEYAEWFVTRLNTNGILLTRKLCDRLYNASLDSVQITLYSNNPEIHNELVGANNFDKTVQGIKNALASGLNVSINTPLCKLNKNYVDTLKFANELGVTYASASGIIFTGNAKNKNTKSMNLSKRDITSVMRKASKYAEEQKMEISFTSPGWIAEEDLRKMKLDIPSCGACLSNMAISPDGNVMPCQSWLEAESSLGNILEVKWEKIWNSNKCKNIRKNSSKISNICPLRGGNSNEKN